MTTPYASATSDMRAREEVKKILRRFGCEAIGFMDDEVKHEVLLAFTHRGRQIQLSASAKGWAQMRLKENPHTYRMRTSRHDHEQAALRQRHVAVNSILRDWIKGQVTAIETGILSFEAVFMPFMLTADGRPLIERIAETNLLSTAGGKNCAVNEASVMRGDAAPARPSITECPHRALSGAAEAGRADRACSGYRSGRRATDRYRLAAGRGQRGPPGSRRGDHPHVEGHATHTSRTPPLRSCKMGHG